MMCKALNDNFDILAKKNHKCLLVEEVHRFINKFITIAVEDRGANDSSVAANLAAGYSCNSAPINETDILRSFSTISR